MKYLYLILTCISVLNFQNVFSVFGLSSLFIEKIGYLIRFAVYCFAIFYIKGNFKNFKIVFMNNKSMLYVFCLVFVSCFWAWNINLSLYMFLTFFMLTLTAISLTILFQIKDFLKFFSVSFFVVLILSVIINNRLLLTGGGTGSIVDFYWSGIYSNSNTLGIYSCIAMLILFFSINFIKFYMSYRFLFLGLSAYCVILSNSRTSILIMFIIAAYAFFQIFNKYIKKYRLIFTTCIIVFLSIIFIFKFETFYIYYLNYESSIGKSSLSGRDYLWTLVYKSIVREPLFGYGYQAFWHGWDGPSAIIWSYMPYYKAIHSHNGFLEIVLSVGFVGLILFLINMFYSLKYAYYLQSGNLNYLLLFFIIFILINITETGALSNSMIWFMYTYFSYYAHIKYNSISFPNSKSQT